MIVIKREIPMMLLASILLVAVSFDAMLDGAVSSTIGRTDGVVLLLVFGVFLYYLTAESIGQRAETASSANAEAKPAVVPAIALSAGGLAALVVGGKIAVDASVGIAEAMGASEVIIGLFLLAVGTSLPELAVSTSAAWRGKTDIAVGNIVGSNIFNILFIIGISASIKPLPIPPGGVIDLVVMCSFAIVLVPMAISQRRIVRIEGAALLVGYAGYIALRAIV
jgi:cation:H+ antiporter